MFSVLSCIHENHDLRLVGFAALICVLSMLAAFRFQSRILNLEGGSRWTGIALIGVISGSGIWATHFIAMVAYRSPVLASYEPVGTAVSLAPAVMCMTAGFALAAYRREVWAHVLGGLIAGAGVVTMHYLGVAAIRMAAWTVWNPAFVVWSVLVALTGGALAFLTARHARGAWQFLIPTAVMVAAVCGLHFTGMTAMRLVPDPALATPVQAVGGSVLAVMISCVVVLILLASIGLFFIEAQVLGLRRLHAAFEGVPSGLALYDKSSRLVMWNQGYHRVMTSCGVTPWIGARRRELLAAAAATGGYDRAEGRLSEWVDEITAGEVSEHCYNDGRWFRVETCPVQTGGAIVVLDEITGQKQAAEAMIEARDRAEAANLSKSEFLANMSHEIRTPLNGVVAIGDMLSRAQLGAEEREMVDILRSSADSLQQLLSDILDFSRIESGRIVIEAAPFNLGELVRSAAALANMRASEKGVVLNVSIAPSLERRVLGDAMRVRQILTNLLSNAVKFTSEGEVSVIASRSAKGLVRLEVRDSGVGFDIAFKERLFTRFQQADGSITRRFGGTGLGLTISRNLAELMEGRIDCESTPGLGSCFWFEAPLAFAEDGVEDTQAPETQVVAPPRALRVLLADDHAINRRVVELMLAEVGASITSVDDGVKAVAAFEDGGYDLVLMDMQMPEMDGLTAIAHIRALESQNALSATPIIMLTANAMPEHVAAAVRAGADHHLGKPITAQSLYAAVDHVLSEVRRDSEAAA